MKFNSQIANMLSRSIKHLEIKNKWTSRNHRNRRKYFKWFHRTEKAWQLYLKAYAQLTPEDKEIFISEFNKAIAKISS